jgi:hypothetical protein
MGVSANYSSSSMGTIQHPYASPATYPTQSSFCWSSGIAFRGLVPPRPYGVAFCGNIPVCGPDDHNMCSSPSDDYIHFVYIPEYGRAQWHCLDNQTSSCACPEHPPKHVVYSHGVAERVGEMLGQYNKHICFLTKRIPCNMPRPLWPCFPPEHVGRFLGPSYGFCHEHAEHFSIYVIFVAEHCRHSLCSNHCVQPHGHAVGLLDACHVHNYVRPRCMLDLHCNDSLVLHSAHDNDVELHQMNCNAYDVVIFCCWHIMWSIGYVCMLLCSRHNHRANQCIIYIAVVVYAIAWLGYENCFPRTVCLAFCCMVVLSSDGPTFVRASAYAAKCCGARRWKTPFRPHLRNMLPSEYVKRVRVSHTLFSFLSCSIQTLCSYVTQHLYKHMCLYVIVSACLMGFQYDLLTNDLSRSDSLLSHVGVEHVSLHYGSGIQNEYKNIQCMYMHECVSVCHEYQHLHMYSLELGTHHARIGEALRPGPTSVMGFCLYVCNVTHIINNAEIIKRTTFDAMCVTEHSIPRSRCSELRDMLGKDFKFHLSGLDKEKTHNTGGTGVVLHGKHFPRAIKPKYKPLNRILNEGRVGLYCLRLSRHLFCNVYVCYGYTNGEFDNHATNRTNDMMSIILSDLEEQGDCPAMIVGDFNSTIKRLPVLNNVIASGMLVDIGATASRYGSIDCDYTCIANSSAQATRRDFVIANRRAEKLIDSFHVDHSTGLSVHAGLCIRFKADPPTDVYTAIDLPKTICDIFKQKCAQVYGAQNRIEAQRARDVQLTKQSKKFVCDTTIPSIPQLFPVRPSTSKKLADSVSDTFCEADADDAQLLREKQDEEDAARITKDQHDEQLCIFHKHMDLQLSKVHDVLIHLLKQNNTEGYMAQYSKAVELAVASFADLDHKQYRELAGRSTVNLKKAVEAPVAQYNVSSDQVENKLSKCAHHHLMQHRRIMSIKSCSIKLARCSEDGKRSRLQDQIVNDLSAFKVVNGIADGYGELVQHFDDHMLSYDFNVFKLQRYADKALHNFRAVRNKQSKKGRAAAKANLAGERAHGRMSRSLKGCSPAPMSCIRRNFDQGPGKPVGSLTSDPAEVDQILRKAWSEITDGNVKDVEAAANNFLDIYGPYCHQDSEWDIGDLTVEDFKATCAADTASAAGLDGWAARDIALLSDKAIGYIVDLLNAVEKGAPWPEHMLHTRAVFLSKDPSKTDDPLAYRILKITSGWYRKWASCRNRKLRGWIASWDCPELNSGVPKKGAQDAWFNTALQLELAQLSGEPIAGASVDVFKCFDQINRALVFMLASRAGMPSRILKPYMRYIDAIKVRYQVGQTVGNPHHDLTSIPQGCPFSMTMVALIMIPWIRKMRAMEVSPRVLADDLLLVATGEGHRAKAIAGLVESIKFFEVMGARVATDKCFSFAGDAPTRKLLADHVWDCGDITIPCKSSFRDLGSHLNLTRSLSGGTLTERIHNVIGMAKRLKWMAVGDEMRERLVLTNLLPAALYGVESIRVAGSALNGLRSAIADAIGPKSDKRSVNLVFDCASANKELDPFAYILVQRVLNIRRTIVKHFGKKGQIGDIIRRYSTYVKPTGYRKPSLWDEAELDDGIEDDHESYCFGPVGLLVDNLKLYACELGDDFVIRCPGEQPIHILDMPWQHLKSAINAIVTRSRAQATNSMRTFCGDVSELDNDTLKSVVNGLGSKEKHVFRHVATGAFWDDEGLAEIQMGDGHCKHCNELVGGPEHVLWDCPVVNQHRKCRELEEVRSKHLPKAIVVGLPPALSSNLTKTPWVDQGSSVGEGDIPDCVASVGKLPNADAKQLLIEHLCNVRHGQGVHVNARNCFASLKADDGEQCLATPWRCLVAAPEAINVYTDGSWLNPLKQFLGLGGAGVWWPHRHIDVPSTQPLSYRKRLSDAEEELAHHRQLDGGLQLFTKIGGFSGSSTRTELAAGIIAICANGPVHIGSDSKAFVDKANELLEIISTGDDPQDRRPWSLTNDGDLWAHFCEVVQAKGHLAIKISWVKGHAKQHHVDSGITTYEDLLGNAQADATADEATALYGPEMLDIAKWFHNRAKAYVRFMKHVSRHIVEAYLIHRQLLDQIDGDKPSPGVVDRGRPYAPLEYPIIGSCRKLVHHASISNYVGLGKQYPRASRVEAFLKALDVSPVTGDQRPITWIELYALFVLRGYELFEVPEHIACAQPSADNRIRDFKNTCRAVVSRTLPENGDAILFSPAQRTRDCLHGVGILGQVPSLMFNVHVSEEDRRNVARALVNVSRQVTATNVGKYLDNRRNFIPRPLRLNGNSGWVSTIKCLSPTGSVDDLWSPAPAKQEVGTALNVAFFKCKHCDRVEPSSCANFLFADLDRMVKCGNRKCLKPSRSRDWRCACEEYWFTCAQHSKSVACASQPTQSHGQATGRIVTSEPPMRKVPKKLASDFQTLLQDDLKRGRKRQHASSVITLGDSSAEPPQRRPKLGAILGKRFGSSSSSC